MKIIGLNSQKHADHMRILLNRVLKVIQVIYCRLDADLLMHNLNRISTGFEKNSINILIKLKAFS